MAMITAELEQAMQASRLGKGKSSEAKWNLLPNATIGGILRLRWPQPVRVRVWAYIHLKPSKIPDSLKILSIFEGDFKSCWFVFCPRTIVASVSRELAFIESFMTL